MKTNQTSLSRTSAQLRRARLNVEGLEDRQLLSMTHTAFARVLGSVSAAGASQTLPLNFAADDLTAPSVGGSVLLSVSAESQTQGFSPTLQLQMIIRGVRTSITPISTSPPTNGLASAVFAIPADAQTLEAVVGGLNNGTGDFQLQAGLAGDMNGDGRITDRDVMLTNLVVKGTSAPAVLTVASVFDYDRDNRFTSADFDIVTQNLGASVSIRPIFVRSDPDHSTATLLTGQTLPGATVQLDVNRDGVFDQTTIANNSGAFQFSLNAGLAGQTVNLQATDRVGQVARATHRVASFPLTSTSTSATGSTVGSTPADILAPVITLNTPTSGVLTNRNIFILGSVRDNSGLPVQVTAQIDQGTVFPVTLNTNGSFRLPTNLALDGSADGSHQVRIFATDQSGLTASSVVTFTLDATPPAAPTLVNSDLTALESITLQGVTEANAYVAVAGRPGVVVADAQGRFQIPNVRLGLGTNALQLVVTDLAGNSGSTVKTIRRVLSL